MGEIQNCISKCKALGFGINDDKIASKDTLVQFFCASLSYDNYFDQGNINSIKMSAVLLNGPFPVHLFFIFLFWTANSKYVHYKLLPVTGFDLRTYGIGRNSSATWATSTAQKYQQRLKQYSHGYHHQHQHRYHHKDHVLRRQGQQQRGLRSKRSVMKKLLLLLLHLPTNRPT